MTFNKYDENSSQDRFLDQMTELVAGLNKMNRQNFSTVYHIENITKMIERIESKLDTVMSHIVELGLEDVKK